MQISKFSDYSFRSLITLALNPDERWTVDLLSEKLNTSSHHMKKVIHLLSKENYICAKKGRFGGLELAMSPDQINLGKILELTENNFNIVECFNQESLCPLMTHGCKLKGIAAIASQQFINVFYQYTLQDLIDPSSPLKQYNQ